MTHPGSACRTGCRHRLDPRQLLTGQGSKSSARWEQCARSPRQRRPQGQRWNARSHELVHGRDQGECEERLAPMDCDRAQSKQSDGEREHEKRATDAEQPLKGSGCNEIRSIRLWNWYDASQEKRSVAEARGRALTRREGPFPAPCSDTGASGVDSGPASCHRRELDRAVVPS